MLLDDLKNIKDNFNYNIGEICDYDEYTIFTQGIVTEMAYISGTPLVDFRKSVEDVMNKTGFEYELVLVSICEVADGDGLKFIYNLIWHDTGIQNFKFVLQTAY